MICPICKGKKTTCSYQHPEGTEYCLKCKICSTCNGTGELEENICFKCTKEYCIDRCIIDSPRIGVRVCHKFTTEFNVEKALNDSREQLNKFKNDFLENFERNYCEWSISQDIVSKLYSVHRKISSGLIETISPFETREKAQEWIDKGENNA